FTALLCVQQTVGKAGNIQKAKIYALPRERVNNVGGIADKRQAMLNVTLGMALAQRHTKTRISVQNTTEALFKGALQLATKFFIFQLHNLGSALGRQRPHDRAPVIAIGVLQWQQRQRAFVGKYLPAAMLVCLLGAHAGNNCMMPVIPLSGIAAGQTTNTGVGTIGSNQQSGA